MIKLFLVEDHQIMRRTLTLLLEQEKDFTVCGKAASGEEALELLVETDADLLLVDVSLPGMSGLELVQEVTARLPGLPCVILSGHSEAVYGEIARTAGAAGYVDKQETDKLISSIRRLLKEERG